MTQSVTRLCNYGLVVVMYLSLFGVSFAQSTPASKPEESFDAVASVLTHPRCLNCHQAQAPKQTDMGKRHTQGVVRGKDGKGAVGLTCNSCHQGSNSVDGHVPGAKHWQLAPLSMSWEGLSRVDLCRQMKDRSRNGNRSGAQIVEHVATEPLVLWSWQPGAKRTVPPLSHADFVAAVRKWADQGQPCPG